MLSGWLGRRRRPAGRLGLLRFRRVVRRRSAAAVFGVTRRTADVFRPSPQSGSAGRLLTCWFRRGVGAEAACAALQRSPLPATGPRRLRGAHRRRLGNTGRRRRRRQLSTRRRGARAAFFHRG